MTEALRQKMIVIDTLADHVAHDHEMWTFCPDCGHSHQFDLAAIVAKAGDMTPDTLRARLRCGKCKIRGGMELRTSPASNRRMKPTR